MLDDESCDVAPDERRRAGVQTGRGAIGPADRAVIADEAERVGPIGEPRDQRGGDLGGQGRDRGGEGGVGERHREGGEEAGARVLQVDTASLPTPGDPATAAGCCTGECRSANFAA